MPLKDEHKALIRSVEGYPLSSKYDIDWIHENHVGSHCLWLAESLSRVMDLRPGMRVLDLGCGKAIASIFLAKEFGLQVWAADVHFDPSDNLKRIREAGVADRCFPLRADARALPFGNEFFDALISINSYQFFGGDDLYLREYLRFLKPGNQLGMVVPGSTYDLEEVPEHLKPYWNDVWQRVGFTYHSADFWRRLWRKSQLVDIDVCEPVPGGGKMWALWDLINDGSGLMVADQGQTFTFLQVVARKRG